VVQSTAAAASTHQGLLLGRTQELHRHLLHAPRLLLHCLPALQLPQQQRLPQLRLLPLQPQLLPSLLLPLLQQLLRRC
jgi:hypothetical protein